MANAAAFPSLTKKWNTIHAPRLITTDCGVHLILSTKENGEIVVSTILVLWLAKHPRKSTSPDLAADETRGWRISSFEPQSLCFVFYLYFFSKKSLCGNNVFNFLILNGRKKPFYTFLIGPVLVKSKCRVHVSAPFLMRRKYYVILSNRCVPTTTMWPVFIYQCDIKIIGGS